MNFLTSKTTALLLLAAILFSPAVAAAADYVIGDGDTLQIAVWGIDRLNFPAKVRPDGMITVPGIGDVTAGGIKPSELQKDLTEKLATIVKNPIVTVTVTDITNSKAYIFGNGVKPGVYDLNRRTTLLQILCSLPDVNSADLKRAYLLRNNEKVKENFYDLFVKGDTNEDLDIEPNDTIFIPAWEDTFVYVLGAVNRPKAIPYQEGMRIMQAILAAEGFNKFASLNDTVVDRKQDGKDIIIPVKLKKLVNDADLSQNIKLMPGDYVIVREGFF